MRSGWLLLIALACSAPKPPTEPPAMLAPRAQGEGFIALDADNVYWIDRGTNLPDPSKRMAKAWRVPKKGGLPKQLASDLGWPRGLVMSGGTLYWAGFVEGKIYALDVAAGTLTALAEHENTPVDVAADGSDVYFLTAPGEVKRVPKKGGPSVVIASGQVRPLRLAVDERSLFWLNGPTHGNDGAVMRCGKDGGGLVALAKGVHEPGELAIDAQWVYWLDRAEGLLMRVEKDGGTPRALVKEQWSATQLAVDAEDIYWQRGERILKVPKEGGKPIEWLKASFLVGALALDARDIYFLENNGGVRAVRK